MATSAIWGLTAILNVYTCYRSKSMSLGTLQSSGCSQVGKKRRLGELFSYESTSLFHLPIWHFVYINRKDARVTFHILATNEEVTSVWLTLKYWHNMPGSQSPLHVRYYRWWCEFEEYSPCWSFSMSDATLWLQCSPSRNMSGSCYLYWEVCHPCKFWKKGKALTIILH